MRIFEYATRFDPVTGQPFRKLECNHIICDFTGEKIVELYGSYSVNFQYDTSTEETFYYQKIDDLMAEIRKFSDFSSVDEYSIRHFIATEPYHFAYSEHTGDVSVLLIQQWIDQFPREGTPLYRVTSVDEAFRVFRAQKITNLLKDGTYSPLQIFGGLLHWLRSEVEMP